jgi:hypothetical protein
VALLMFRISLFGEGRKQSATISSSSQVFTLILLRPLVDVVLV